MNLRVYHRTRYVYRTAVTDSHNEVRLRPATEDPRRLHFFLLKVHPPKRLRHRRDDFFNYVQWFDIPEPHTELIIEATSHVVTTSPYTEGRPLGCNFWQYKEDEASDMLHPFLSGSEYVSIENDVWRLAIDAREDRQDVFESAEAIMNFIHSGWSYTPHATHAQTHMNEVLADRRGVCQDFAHVMLGMCRTQGIPARYVSGYLYNGPMGHLRGAMASHAWCEVWLPGRGWYGLDPTNNTLADERYVKIATGRDYADAAPIRGSFSGPHGATSVLEVKVEVEEMKASAIKRP
ncbi:MAG: transglutaminase family protein [Verrucomicrobiaceae bacterium]|nr:transglutaminase family protein [Verrucomicrobiaceae bacterium]